ncbi:MAG: DUF4132 domain-containing protein [Actinomycetaceae bacterium]|nr:DUF4132 domain-containing protein [Actinomycetaceae bacterium]
MSVSDFPSLLLDPPAEGLSEVLRTIIDNRIDALRSQTTSDQGADQRNLAELTAISDTDLDILTAIVGGENKELPAAFSNYHAGWYLLRHLPMPLVHRFRICVADRRKYNPLWQVGASKEDPRSIQEIRDAFDYPRQEYFTEWVWRTYEPERVWPWAFADPQRLRERLASIRGAPDALRALEAAPTIPEDILPDIVRIALGTSTVNRPLARRVFHQSPVALTSALNGLTGNATQRLASAQWLSECQDPSALPALREAVAKEKAVNVRGAMIQAVAACGGSVQEYVEPDVLLAEARKGLQRAVPTSLRWLDLADLPPMRWKDGTDVDAAVVRWWVVLAAKTRDPSGHGLFRLYLDCLDSADAAHLGTHLLQAWVEHDYVCAAFETRQHWARWESESVEHIRQAEEKWKEMYGGNAITNKGLLALTIAMEGSEFADTVQEYERKGKRGQGEHRFHLLALQAALAANGAPECLALLQKMASSHKMRTVQEGAVAQLEQVARWRGWSADELADRTILSGGFDEEGRLLLSYGSREFTAQVMADMKIELRDSSGSVVKKLPEPNSADDFMEASAAKTALTRARREVKSVVAVQSARLYEAMCSQRMWPSSEWLSFFAGHPIMGRLLPRLVWICHPQGGFGEDTSARFLFRPLGNGTYINDEGGALTLPEDCEISVAHSAVISGVEAEKWRHHLKTEGASPLFDQFSATLPPCPLNVSSCTEKAGYVMTTFALRNMAKKRGYVRGQVLGAGWFYDYVKPFHSIGYEAVVTFSGSSLPEEDRECAVIACEIHKYGKPVPLDSVPPVLVAECYTDYCTMADIGTYDGQWKLRFQ